MSEGRMHPERFMALLDAYGADPRRWPEAERKFALEHLMASREARELRQKAARLDALLDTVPRMQATPALEQRILRNVPGQRRAARGGFAAGALAASLLLGFIAGTMLQPDSEGAGSESAVGDFLQLAQLADTYQDF